MRFFAIYDSVITYVHIRYSRYVFICLLPCKPLSAIKIAIIKRKPKVYHAKSKSSDLLIKNINGKIMLNRIVGIFK